MKRKLLSAIALRQYENQLMAQAYERVLGALGGVIGALKKSNPTAVGMLDRGWRVVEFSKNVDVELESVYEKLQKEIDRDLKRVGEAVSKFNARDLEQVIEDSDNHKKIKLLNRDEVAAIITDVPIQGATLSDWWKWQKQDLSTKLERQVLLGLQDGETFGKLVERIDKTMETGGRHAQTLARTAITDVRATVDKQTFEQNPDLTEWYIFEAKLDHRTSAICQSLDGKKFRYDDPAAPRPPMHFNCRSKIRPVIKWAELGLNDPNVKRKAMAEKIKGNVRKREVVDDDIDYEGWLKKQKPEFQDEVLGAQRAKWFRAGKVTLPDLVKSDGRKITIEELERRLG